MTAGTALREETRTRPRVRAIDGLRGIAIAGVLAYHALPTLAPGGFLGVEVFFVLSGYLLTALLLDEHRRTGGFDWRRYARRRIKRIGPALGVFLMALVVIGSVVAASDAYRLRADVLWSAFGLTNWHLIRDGHSYFTQLGRPPLVRHLWSLAIEIQFYALVPAMVAWLVRQRRRDGVLALAGAMGASSLLMALLASGAGATSSRAYYGTDTRIGGLLAGALLAYVLSTSPGWNGGEGARAAAARRRPLVGVAGLAGLAWLVVLLLRTDEASPGLYPWAFLACRLATVMVIVGVSQTGWLADALGSARLRWLGLRSYSIYLWHWPLLALVRPGIDVAWPPVVATGLAVSGALFLGNLSFLYLEWPFLRRRPAEPERPRRHRAVHATAVSTMALAVAASLALLVRLPGVDPIARNLAAGQHLLASRAAEAAATAPPPSTLTLPRPTTTTTAAPTTVPTTAPGTVPTTGAPPPPPPPMVPAPRGNTGTLIGDSVMLSAAHALDRRFAATVYVNATLNRQFSHAIDVVRALRAEGVLAGSVIVHLGTNGAPKPEDIDALVAELAGSRDILLVTVRTPQRWQDDTNRVLTEAAARHPAVKIVDWHGYSEGHRDWFESDGTHVKPVGAQAYAELLASALVGPLPAAAAATAPAAAPAPAPAPRPGG